MSVGPESIDLPCRIQFTPEAVMDSQVNLIFQTLRENIASPRERQAAAIRAGLLAQAYANCDDSILEEVFGLAPERVLKNDVDMDRASLVGRR
jgi:hypothetical protein